MNTEQIKSEQQKRFVQLRAEQKDRHDNIYGKGDFDRTEKARSDEFERKRSKRYPAGPKTKLEMRESAWRKEHHRSL